MAAVTEQLALGGVPIPPKPRKPSKLLDVCACLHSCSRDHEGGKGACTFVDNGGWRCDCPKARPRGRVARPAPPSLERPFGAEDWYRCPPELVRRKVGGWYHWTETTVGSLLRVVIADTLIESYNAIMKRAGACFDKELARRLIAGDANKRRAQRYRLEAALEQAEACDMGPCSDATITRVASPRMSDDDNLIPSCKHLRDEIAASLGFDDSRFNVGGSSGSGGDIPLFYKQQTAGARRARAVVIDIEWRTP